MKESQHTEKPPERVQLFMPGDIVRLRSGGPLMTVSHLESDYGRIDCSWFARITHCSSSFKIEEVTRIEDEQYKETARRHVDWGLESLDKWNLLPKDQPAGEKKKTSRSTDE